MSRAKPGTPDSAGSEPAEQPLPKGEIFDLLRNQRRRFVIHYLKSTDGSVELGELATRVAAWEYDEPLEQVDSGQRKRVYTTLQQTHLPKLDDAGIVDFDDGRGVVEPREVLSDLTIYLEIVPHNEFAWHEYYLGLGAVCTALMAAVWTGIYPFTVVPPIVWGSVISLAVIGSAAVNIYAQRSMGIGDADAPPEVEFDDVER